MKKTIVVLGGLGALLGSVIFGYTIGYAHAAEDFQAGSAPTAEREDYGSI